MHINVKLQCNGICTHIRLVALLLFLYPRPHTSLTLTPHSPPHLTHPHTSLIPTSHSPSHLTHPGPTHHSPSHLTHPHTSLTLTPHSPPHLTHPHTSLTPTPHSPSHLTHPHTSLTLTPHSPSHLTYQVVYVEACLVEHPVGTEDAHFVVTKVVNQSTNHLQ